jgi:hypothetical protein
MDATFFVGHEEIECVDQRQQTGTYYRSHSEKSENYQYTALHVQKDKRLVKFAVRSKLTVRGNTTENLPLAPSKELALPVLDP